MFNGQTTNILANKPGHNGHTRRPACGGIFSGRKIRVHLVYNKRTPVSLTFDIRIAALVLQGYYRGITGVPYLGDSSVGRRGIVLHTEHEHPALGKEHSQSSHRRVLHDVERHPVPFLWPDTDHITELGGQQCGKAARTICLVATRRLDVSLSSK